MSPKAELIPSHKFCKNLYKNTSPFLVDFDKQVEIKS